MIDPKSNSFGFPLFVLIEYVFHYGRDVGRFDIQFFYYYNIYIYNMIIQCNKATCVWKPSLTIK